MAIEIVDFPSYKMVDLSIAMLVHQRVGFEEGIFFQSPIFGVCELKPMTYLTIRKNIFHGTKMCLITYIYQQILTHITTSSY